jgi:circadian clock protein KaiC
MMHSNQIREYLLTDNGIEIKDVYLGPSGGLLMGSARAVQETEEVAEAIAQRQNAERKKRELESRLKALDAQIALLNSESEVQKEELDNLVSEEKSRDKAILNGRSKVAGIRKADVR